MGGHTSNSKREGGRKKEGAEARSEKRKAMSISQADHRQDYRLNLFSSTVLAARFSSCTTPTISLLDMALPPLMTKIGQD